MDVQVSSLPVNGRAVAEGTYAETDFRAVIGALEVVVFPDSGITPDVIIRPSGLFTVRGQSRACVAVARLLYRIAGLLVAPVRWGPSPCCPREFLVSYPSAVGMLSCSRDGRLYADTEWEA